ncbi:unnamed protein product [Amoebophrya sp. A120]|nr:unnamed protein product [Amoebophrya sp. A120]|eukprot:GSA120T00001169001.1
MMMAGVADEREDNSLHANQQQEITEKTKLLPSPTGETTRKPAWIDKEKYVTASQGVVLQAAQKIATRNHVAPTTNYNDADGDGDLGDHDTAFQQKLYAPYLITSKFKIWCVCAVWMYYGMVLSTYVAFTIPLEAMRMAPAWQSSFVVLERVIYGLMHLTAPFFGKLSDETRHPWGKRRPLLVAGAFLLLASHTMLFFASDRLQMYTYLFALAGAMVAKNLIIACTSGYLADVVPKELSSTVSGITTLQCATGCLIGFGLQYLLASTAVKFTYVYVTGFYMLGALLFFFVASEPPSDVQSLQRLRQEFEKENTHTGARSTTTQEIGIPAPSTPITPSTTAQHSATDTESVASSHLVQNEAADDYYTNRQPRYNSTNLHASLADRSTRAPSLLSSRGPTLQRSGYSSDGQTSGMTDDTEDSDAYMNNRAEDIIDTHMRYTHYNSVAVVANSTNGASGDNYDNPRDHPAVDQRRAQQEQTRIAREHHSVGEGQPLDEHYQKLMTQHQDQHNNLDSNVDKTKGEHGENKNASWSSNTTTCCTSLAAASQYMSSFWSTFWHALTISPDYQYLVLVRIFFYAGCSSMSMFLFYLRDALHVPTKAEGIQKLSSLAMISQCAIIVVAVGATLLTSRVYAQKMLIFLGLGAMMLTFLTLSFLPMLTPEYANLHNKNVYVEQDSSPTSSSLLTESTLSMIVHVGGFGYGLGTGCMAVGDMGLALKLVPAGVGNGAAMSIFGPSITYGFVLGSIMIGTVLQYFKIPGGAEDKEHSAVELATAASRKQQPLDHMASTTAPPTSKADFNGVLWEPGYTEGGHQVIAMCSLVLCGISAALLYTVDTRRALAKTANGEQE